MNISSILEQLEILAPLSYQEPYDNAGLLTGHPDMECTGILVSLDLTEAVIAEAKAQRINLIISHHPVIFSGIKKLNGKNLVERCVIAAIRADIALYAIHTNLDNMLTGVNARIADKIGLVNRRPLVPRAANLFKLVTFVPVAYAEAVRQALFAAGAGTIGDYTGVSFNSPGTGTFLPGAGTRPFAGEPGLPREEPEIRLELILEKHREATVVKALLSAHPYEEVAYDLIALQNTDPRAGADLIGELREPLTEPALLETLKTAFGCAVIRHSPFTGRPVQRVAVCGGSGSALISNALEAKMDVFITADIRYHAFFEGEGRLLIADIGHYESEQFTVDLLYDRLVEKFRNFAILKTGVGTNPVNYYF